MSRVGRGRVRSGKINEVKLLFTLCKAFSSPLPYNEVTTLKDFWVHLAQLVFLRSLNSFVMFDQVI